MSVVAQPTIREQPQEEGMSSAKIEQTHSLARVSTLALPREAGTRALFIPCITAQAARGKDLPSS